MLAEERSSEAARRQAQLDELEATRQRSKDSERAALAREALLREREALLAERARLADGEMRRLRGEHEMALGKVRSVGVGGAPVVLCARG